MKTLPTALIGSLLIWAKALLCQSGWDARFAKHLFASGNKVASAAYLDAYADSLPPDSLCFWKLHFHAVFFEEDIIMSALQRPCLAAIADQHWLNIIDARFFQASDSLRRRWFELDRTQWSIPTESSMGLGLYKAPLLPSLNDIPLPAAVLNSMEAYRYSQRKTATGAFLRSLALPGWGRYYLGRKKSGLSTFIGTSLLAVQSMESSRRLGVQHPWSIASIALFSIFYAGELYLCLTEPKVIQEERLIQYYHDCSDYLIDLTHGY